MCVIAINSMYTENVKLCDICVIKMVIKMEIIICIGLYD